MTHAQSPVAYTVDTHTADGHLIQRDARPHSPWYAYTPRDADGIRTYLGCGSTAGHAHQLIARHRADRPPAVPAVAHPSASARRAR